jgi:tetrahydromethanopterin S-methyltransferase subunit C
MSLLTREARMKELRNYMNLLHPFNLCALKGNEHQELRTRITVQNNRYVTPNVTFPLITFIRVLIMHQVLWLIKF